MLSHDYANKLLALPNLQMSCYYEPRVVEEIDTNHPDYKDFDEKNQSSYTESDSENLSVSYESSPSDKWQAWYDSMPKKQVIRNH